MWVVPGGHIFTDFSQSGLAQKALVSWTDCYCFAFHIIFITGVSSPIFLPDAYLLVSQEWYIRLGSSANQSEMMGASCDLNNLWPFFGECGQYFTCFSAGFTKMQENWKLALKVIRSTLLNGTVYLLFKKAYGLSICRKENSILPLRIGALTETCMKQ